MMVVTAGREEEGVWFPSLKSGRGEESNYSMVEKRKTTA